MLIKPQIRMKKFTLFLFFIGGLVSMQALDSSWEENPFEFLGSFDEMAFSENYNIELEYRFSNSFHKKNRLH